MPLHSLVKIYVHVIWATHKRERDLHEKLRTALPAELGVAKVVKSLKGESSRWINEQNLAGGRFQWQRGYGAFSVSASQLAKVKTYVENQDEHHAKKTFAEEYKA